MPKTHVSLQCDDISYGWFAAGTQVIVAIFTGFLNVWIAFGIIVSLILGVAAESWKKGKKNGNVHQPEL